MEIFQRSRQLPAKIRPQLGWRENQWLATPETREKGWELESSTPRTITATLPPTPKHEHRPTPTTARGRSPRQAPPPCPLWVPKAGRLDPKRGPGPAAWALQPSSAPADARRRRGGPTPGSARSFSHPPRRPSGVLNAAKPKEASPSEGAEWENGARRHLPENGVWNGLHRAWDQGRPRCRLPRAGRSRSGVATSSRCAEPPPIPAPSPATHGAQKRAGRRLTRAEKRPQTQQEEAENKVPSVLFILKHEEIKTKKAMIICPNSKR